MILRPQVGVPVVARRVLCQQVVWTQGPPWMRGQWRAMLACLGRCVGG